MRFQIDIDTGNAEFRDGHRLGIALIEVATHVAGQYPVEEDIEAEGLIHDVNGNRVGRWTFTHATDVVTS